MGDRPFHPDDEESSSSSSSSSQTPSRPRPTQQPSTSNKSHSSAFGEALSLLHCSPSFYDARAEEVVRSCDRTYTRVSWGSTLACTLAFVAASPLSIAARVPQRLKGPIMFGGLCITSFVPPFVAGRLGRSLENGETMAGTTMQTLRTLPPLNVGAILSTKRPPEILVKRMRNTLGPSFYPAPTLEEVYHIQTQQQQQQQRAASTSASIPPRPVAAGSASYEHAGSNNDDQFERPGSSEYDDHSSFPSITRTRSPATSYEPPTSSAPNEIEDDASFSSASAPSFSWSRYDEPASTNEPEDEEADMYSYEEIEKRRARMRDYRKNRRDRGDE